MRVLWMLFLAAALMVLPAPALAAFPGENGKLVVNGAPGWTGGAYVVSSDGSKAERIMPVADGGRTYAWSPDGQHLVYDTYAGGGAGIAVARADGTLVRFLTAKGSDACPNWSPDGSKVAFLRNDEIFTVSISGGPAWRLTFGGAGCPHWSPANNRIVFASSGWKIQSISGSGGNRRTLVRLSDPGERSDWTGRFDLSPDGTRIALWLATWTPRDLFPGDTLLDPNGSLTVVDLRSGSLAAVPNSESRYVFPGGVAWSPDGTELAYTVGTPRSMGLGGGGIIGVDGSGRRSFLPEDLEILTSSPVDWQPLRAGGEDPGGLEPVVPPETRITRAPQAETRKRTALFRFASSKPDSTFRCKLNRRAWTICSSPVTYRGLPRREHRFKVWAVDATVTPDPSAAVHRWRVLPKQR